METQFTPEVVQIYYFRYVREYRAVAVVWAILTIIWCILNVVCFVQPQWIGDTEESPGYGHLGVYAHCFPAPPNYNRYACNGTFGNFDEILTDAFRATTFFCGVAALIMLICVAALMLFFCFKKTAVFIFCGILELVVAVFMIVACIIYPAGWDHAQVMEICGKSAGPYKLGDCGIRWAYVLAILGIFDSAFLAVLAFILASKRAKDGAQSVSGSYIKSEPEFYDDTFSRKSMPIQPQLMRLPPTLDQDKYSDNYSRVSGRPVSRSGFQL
jgi:hypothetical protein